MCDLGLKIDLVMMAGLSFGWMFVSYILLQRQRKSWLRQLELERAASLGHAALVALAEALDGPPRNFCSRTADAILQIIEKQKDEPSA